jgi:hypothetical protein
LYGANHGGIVTFMPVEGDEIFLLLFALRFLLLFLPLFLDVEYGGACTWGGTGGHADGTDMVPVTRAGATSTLAVCFGEPPLEGGNP